MNSANNSKITQLIKDYEATVKAWAEFDVSYDQPAFDIPQFKALLDHIDAQNALLEEAVRQRNRTGTALVISQEYTEVLRARNEEANKRIAELERDVIYWKIESGAVPDNNVSRDDQ